ncbi:MAG: hypothetical protein QOI04_2274 [Verrucomicrobiota bacterium]|jgi:NAD(P)-dependent dehydrogenase (short-subunit alcohol dehydrogenase family)
MKRVFLTGASSGIGLAIAKALSARADEVWGTARDAGRIPAMEKVHPLRMDLRDLRSITTAFDTALSAAKHIDVLINNAGSGSFGPAELLSTEMIADEFQVLVFGQIELMRLALAAMRKQECGLIINVTSLAARLPVPFMAAYNAAKAAMASFTMSIQLELAGSNIRIVDLAPADISTPFNDAVRKIETADSYYQKRVDKTWVAVEKNLRAAPKPELVARHVLRLIDQSNPPPRVMVGDFFQARIAPFILRFLPQRLQLWGLKKYYGI